MDSLWSGKWGLPPMENWVVVSLILLAEVLTPSDSQGLGLRPLRLPRDVHLLPLKTPRLKTGRPVFRRGRE